MAPLDLVKAPPGATSPELRRLGLKGLVLGIVLFVPGLFWFLFAKDWAYDTFGTRIGDYILLPRWVVVAVGGPVAVGYCLLMIGLSRLIFGAAAHKKSVLASIGRILFGVIVSIGMVFVAFQILAATRGR